MLCDECTTYLDQVRRTVALVGRLPRDSLGPRIRDRLLRDLPDMEAPRAGPQPSRMIAHASHGAGAPCARSPPARGPANGEWLDEARAKPPAISRSGSRPSCGGWSWPATSRPRRRSSWQSAAGWSSRWMRGTGARPRRSSRGASGRTTTVSGCGPTTPRWRSWPPFPGAAPPADANVCGWLPPGRPFVLGGADGYRRERESQSRWLVERLQLRGRTDVGEVV